MRRPHVYERSAPRARRPAYHEDGPEDAEAGALSAGEAGGSEGSRAAGSPIIIGLCGLAGSGKSTAARHLVEHHGFVRRPFAGPLKDMLRSLLLGQGVPAAEVERMVDGDLRELPARALDGRTPCHAMQTLGTEWGRALSPTLWVNAWKRSLKGLERVVADDVRFENEAQAVRDMGGLDGAVVEIVRPDLVPIAGGHASEAGVRRISIDAIVLNFGTRADLTAQMDACVGQ